MSQDYFDAIRQEIANHESNSTHMAQGYMPLFLASPKSKIVIVGQAPGIKAQESGLAWNDASGRRLMGWLGVDEEQFRDTSIFAHVPMDFYYPGKGKSGDLPPRTAFAPMWHDRILSQMPNVKLTIPIGKYAQRYYLPGKHHSRLTDTVRNYHEYLPDFFPLVHPSPLNFRWFAKNKWFEQEAVPVLRQVVADIVNDS